MRFGVIAACLAIASAWGHGAFAQESLGSQAVFPHGASFGYGTGRLGLRDEFISAEKYAGALPFLTASWSHFHEGHGHALGIEFRRSEVIRNHNASTEITQFALRQEIHYPLPRTRVFSRDAFLFLGPVTEILVLTNAQHVAVANPNYAMSAAALLSLGVGAKAVVPMRPGIQAEAAMRLSVLSLGVRAVDPENDDASPVGLLTPLSGTNASVRLGVRARVNGHLSAVLSYGVHLLRIRSWDPLLSADDAIVAGLTVGF